MVKYAGLLIAGKGDKMNARICSGFVFRRRSLALVVVAALTVVAFGAFGDAGMSDDYQRVAYVEATGQQWINLGVKENVPHGFAIGVKKRDDGSGNGYGYLISGTKDNFTLSFHTDVNHYYAYACGAHPIADKTAFTVTAADGFLVVAGTNGVLTVDGVRHADLDTSKSIGSGSNYIWLFNCPNNNTGRLCSGKISFVKLYDVDGKVIHDYVPCYEIANPSNVGVYDTVDGVFYGNAGSGAGLIAGPDVSSPDLLRISGSPTKVGTVSPSYGNHSGWHPGDPIVCTVDEKSVVNQEGTLRATCVGYRLYYGTEVKDEKTFAADEPCSVTFSFPDNATGARLEWVWENEYKVTAAASDHGSVTFSGEWFAHGATVTATATADDGYGFSQWTTGVTEGWGMKWKNPVSVVVTGPTVLTAAFAAGSFGKLDPLYQEIEYVQSSGAQRIDTGVKATEAYGFEFCQKGYSASGCPLSATRDNFTIGYFNTSSYYVRWNNGTELTRTMPLNSSVFQTIAITNGVLTKDGAKVGACDTAKTLGTGATDINLFMPPGEANRAASCKVSSLRLYDAEGGLLRDLVPCYPVTDATRVGFYDRRNGVFYENVASGAPLTAGPDLRRQDSLRITAEPLFYGEPVPSYGGAHVVRQGDTKTFSMPVKSLQNDEGTMRATCVGYRVLTDGHLAQSGTFGADDDCTFDFTFTDNDHGFEVIWQWSIEYKMTAETCENGAVEVSADWVPYGGTVTVRAKPASGYAFTGWTKGVGGEQAKSSPAQLTVTAPIAFAATFEELPDVVRTWTGTGANAKASNPDNWVDGQVPQNLESVLLDASCADHPILWDLDITVNNWTQTEDYTNVVTFATVFPGKGTFTSFHIAGNATVEGGVWTHQKNSNSETYRLAVEVAGDMTIGSNVVFNANEIGNSGAQGKSGASHGGRGSGGSDPFGSYYAPVNTGRGGEWGGGSGGAIRLVVGGKLAHDGLMTANAQAATHPPSAGSIWITAGAIEGEGRLSAVSGSAGDPAAGGRIAVILTGAESDFSDYDIVTLATAKSTSNGAAPGTIYAETAADTPTEGWLILKGNGTLPGSSRQYATPFTPSITSATFAKLTLTNNVYFVLDAGQTLDLSAAEVVADDANAAAANGIYLNGGTLLVNESRFVQNFGVSAAVPWIPDTDEWVIAGRGALTVGSEMNFAGSLTVKDACKLTVNAPLRVGGDVTLEDTATVDTKVWASSADLLGIFAGGDFTIGENVVVSADARGCASTPPGTAGNGTAGAHGGVGSNGTKPYDSVCTPSLPGAHGAWDVGGGVIRLEAVGAMTVDGVVTASGSTANNHSGAGGAIQIVAATLTGGETAAIRANGGREAGGGRVAVSLTDADATFDGFLGKIEAKGSGAGPGTVYLRERGAAIGEGTLSVSGSGTAWIGCVDEAYGNVVIGNGSTVKLADNATITVTGDWLNEGTFTAGANSTVVFAGAGESRFSGNNTFVNFSADAPGKTVVFADGATLRVTGTAALTGSATDHLVLTSANEGTAWNLDASASLTDVDLRDCASAVAVIDINGADLGGNSGNVTFMTVAPGDTITWTGAANGSFADPANWNPSRAPIATDHVVIPSGTANVPTLPFAAKAWRLTVDEGATLDLNGLNLIVADSLTVNGTLMANGAPTVTVGGDLTVAGALVAENSVFRLNGENQTVAAADGVRFHDLVATSEELAFATSLTAHGLTLGDGEKAMSVTFAKDAVCTLNDFTVQGDAETKNVTLATAGGAGSWILKANRSTVSGATVSGSDASKGPAVVPADGAFVDAGGNLNWLSPDTRLHWTGALSSDFSKTSNWLEGRVPTASDAVVIEGTTEVVIGSSTTVAALTMGVGAQVTVNAPLTVNGALVVEPEGTLVANQPILVNGNVALLEGAVVTHDGPTKSKTKDKQVDITATGDFNVNVGATIDVSGKGYGSTYYPGGTDSGIGGGVHAGYCRVYGGGVCGVAPYGSVRDPMTWGSAGFHADGYPGGGAIKLTVGGVLTVDGTITANTITRSGAQGAAGSVNLTARTLVGTGAITANSGSNTAGDSQADASGGRVAVKLTGAGADFSDFAKGAITANGGNNNRTGKRGGAGTVYLKTGDQSIENGGTLKIVNPGATNSKTPVDGAGRKVKFYDELVVGGSAQVHLASDLFVGALTLDDTATLDLNGHTLKVSQPRPKTWPKDGYPANVTLGGDSEHPGQVKWNDGFFLHVR